jgi:hypothetical protein
MKEYREVEVRGAVKKFAETFDIDSLVRTAWTDMQGLQRLRDAVQRKRDKWQAGTVVSASR